MTEESVSASPVIVAARKHVVLAAIASGTKVRTNRNAPGSTLSRIQPVTCILLPGGDLLTAAHTLPEGHLGAIRVKRDPATGEFKMDTSGTIATGGPPIFIILDGDVIRGRVSASETLGYSAAGAASRESISVDWAVISPDKKMHWEKPVNMIARPTPGEACFMIGYPIAMMDQRHFAFSGMHTKPDEIPWLGVPGAVIPGVIGTVEDDLITIKTDTVLGSRARGLSGGGVFVTRNGRPALVGIAVVSSNMTAKISACPLPEIVTRRFEQP